MTVSQTRPASHAQLRDTTPEIGYAVPLLQRVGLVFGSGAQHGAAGGVLVRSGLERVMAVAERAFGLSLTPQQVEGPWPSARILPLLDDMRRRSR